jgi:hypothetical protein
MLHLPTINDLILEVPYIIIILGEKKSGGPDFPRMCLNSRVILSIISPHTDDAEQLEAILKDDNIEIAQEEVKPAVLVPVRE